MNDLWDLATAIALALLVGLMALLLFHGAYIP
jgi:hypothetical protein